MNSVKSCFLLYRGSLEQHLVLNLSDLQFFFTHTWTSAYDTNIKRFTWNKMTHWRSRDLSWPHAGADVGWVNVRMRSTRYLDNNVIVGLEETGLGDDPRGHEDYHSMDDPSSLGLFTKSHRAATRLARATTRTHIWRTWAQLRESVQLRTYYPTVFSKQWWRGPIESVHMHLETMSAIIQRANSCLSTSRVIHSNGWAKPRERCK